MRLAIAIVLLFILGAPLSAREPGASYVETLPEFGATFEMIAIPGGEFTMQAMEVDPRNAAKIVHHDEKYRVKLSPYWIGKYEMTWNVVEPWALPKKSFIDEFDRIDEQTKIAFAACPTLWGLWSDDPPRMADLSKRPVGGLSQFGAKRYCHWLSLMTGRFYRLPTEAEWEFACRAGSTSKYPWGEEPPDQDRIDPIDESLDGLSVGAAEPNAWGLYDMLGNLNEWVADGFSEGYSAFPKTGTLADPIAWPVGNLETQNEPFQNLAETTDLLVAQLRQQRFIGRWEEKHRALDDRELVELRKQFLREGQIVALGPGVARGGSDNQTVSPTPEHYACAARYLPTRNPDTATPDIVFDNSMYWSEGLYRRDVGFRVARPEKVPSRKVQLWHWGIYEHHEFWLKYTIPPSE